MYVTAVNDAPVLSIASATATILEDHPLLFGPGDITLLDVDDGEDDGATWRLRVTCNSGTVKLGISQGLRYNFHCIASISQRDVHTSLHDLIPH